MKPYYQDAQVTLYHGDCRDFTHLSADALVTDPQYGINFAGQPTKWQRLAGARAERWDERPFAELHSLLSLAPVQCVWGGNYYHLEPSRGWLVWIKPDAPPSMGTVELAWTNMDRCAAHIVHSIAATNPERLGHPTQKPLRVMTWCLEKIPGNVVLDPFCGSGTTLRAAKDLGRKAIGIEIEERYCEIAAKRCAQEVLDFGRRTA